MPGKSLDGLHLRPPNGGSIYRLNEFLLLEPYINFILFFFGNRMPSTVYSIQGAEEGTGDTGGQRTDTGSLSSFCPYTSWAWTGQVPPRG